MKFHIKISKPYMSNALRRIDEAFVYSGIARGHSFSKGGIPIVPVVSINDVNDLKDGVVLQLCHKTAGGSEEEWQEIWSKNTVISYLKLPTNYGRFPLGYDPSTFYKKKNVEKKYDAIVTGYVDGEGAERIKDVVKTFDKVCHVGKNFGLGPGYYHFENVTDIQMNWLYNQSKYVVALREVEGFELPVIEGAAAGCIPVVYNLECYAHWFESLAILVERDLSIIEQVLPPDDIEQKVKRFRWDRVMTAIWEYLESVL